MHIIYKPGPNTYIINKLSSYNHEEKRDQETAGMRVNVNAIRTSVNIPVCTSIQEIQAPTHEDAYLQELKAYIIQGWSYKKEEVDHSTKQYWPIRHELAVIDER